VVIPDRAEGGSGLEAERPLSSGPPLISTKLRPPVSLALYRARPRLGARLGRALDDEIRLTLISAPPGYGKSVALAGWVASTDKPTAWLSLDAADNDPVRFVRYLVAALQPLRPGIALAARALPGVTDGTELAAFLIDAVAHRDDPFVLVLDDYHVITAEPVHALVRLLVAQGPPFMHLVVSTREDPPFPLSRLRAHGRLLELRAEDLRFTLEEAASYLAATPDIALDAAHVERLVERTEGWIAGMQLASISLRNRPDAPALVDELTGSQRFVLDYLAAEVLEGIDPDLRAFLVRCSVVERFTADLCSELSGRADSAQLLERAERLNLFLVPLDLERRWFRFHHLFADYLRLQLGDAERRGLHARAAEWLEDAGLPGEAIDQALAAGAFDQAVRYLEREGVARYQTEELLTLLGWLEALPGDRVTGSPILAALHAAALFFTGRISDAARTCDESGAVLESLGASAAGLHAVRALVAQAQGQAGTAALARQALDELGPADAAFRPMALQALGTAQVLDGELPAAVATMRAALHAGLSTGQSMVAIPALTMLATALNLTGQRGEAEELCRRVLAHFGATSGPLHGAVEYAAYWLGMLCYEANDLVAARHELERAWEAAGRFGHGRVLLGTSVAYVCLGRLATGADSEAFEALRTFRAEARAVGSVEMDAPFAEIEARLQVYGGNVAAAAGWADVVEGRVPAVGSSLPALLTLARVRLAQGRARETASYLRQARVVAEAADDVADLISVAVLEATRAEQTGERRLAQRSMEEAITSAAPGHYVRRVVDDGRTLFQLLPAVRRIAPAFVDEVLGAVAASPRSPAQHSKGVSLWRDERGELVETLTPRELEVLRLMAAGLGDGEIAEALTVSLATAKWHGAHVRAKLGASTRTKALAIARQLGLV
jgi:LuxR family transcriptional regulator, maltose regulon positive regulatory protein